MIPLVSIYGNIFGILNSRATLIFMNLGFGTGMAIFMCHGFIKTNVPMALEEAAKIDGCTRLQIFFKIVLPLMKPILSTITILNTLGLWNDYLLPKPGIRKESIVHIAVGDPVPSMEHSPITLEKSWLHWL